MSISRAAFLMRILSYLDSPYIYGARGHMLAPGQVFLPGGRIVGPGDASKARRVFDCSGVPLAALHEEGGLDLRATHNSDSLFNGLPSIEAEELQPGDLIFYDGSGPADVGHVEVYLGGRHVVGASGGTSTTNSLEAAQARTARVYVKPNFTARPHLRGFRSIQPLLEGQRIPS